MYYGYSRRRHHHCDYHGRCAYCGMPYGNMPYSNMPNENHINMEMPRMK